MIILKGKTLHGKNRVREHGERWRKLNATSPLRKGEIANDLNFHIGHATAQERSKQRTKNLFVIELLNDAIDAIAINHPEIATKRINAAIRILKGE